MAAIRRIHVLWVPISHAKQISQSVTQSGKRSLMHLLSVVTNWVNFGTTAWSFA
jgi:hypothetical protein